MSTAKRGIDAKRAKDGKWTKILLKTIDTPAWRELPPKSQSLYLWLKLEWKGPKNNNNGKIALSCRQAAQKMGVSLNTAASAFRLLQAKGFIFVTRSSQLGLEGKAKLQLYEILSYHYQDLEVVDIFTLGGLTEMIIPLSLQQKQNPIAELNTSLY